MRQKNFLKTFFILLILVSFNSFSQVLNDNFDDGDITDWTNTADWTSSTSSPLNGTNSLKHNLSGVAGSSYISKSISSLNLTTQNATWQFNLKNGSFDPSGTNKFWVYLAGNESDLSSGTIDGYAVGVNFSGSSDILTLWKVTDGAAVSAIVTSSFDWNSGSQVGIKVTRNTGGLWELSVDTDGDFDSLVSQGTATDADYTDTTAFGLSFTYTSSRAGLLRMDDVFVEGVAPPTDPTISFDAATSSVTETNTSFDINIPVTMTNFDSDVQINIGVNGASTAEGGDYSNNTPSLFFVANETQNISLTINPDADSDSETVILDISVSFGSADLGISQHTITITDDDLPNIIINEILADPNGIDANGDGTVSSDNDEFIEIVNLDGSSYDLTGYTISDASLRYTFGATTIPAGGSVVIFGGGTPTGIPGISDTTSSLGLANGGDTVTLRNSGGNTIATYTYGSEGGDDQSIGRSDDSSGGFVKHSTIATNPVTASPGRTNVSNLPFITLTWAGATNIWETDANWTSGNKPTASDDVIIPSGLSFYPTIETGINAVANTITIASGATLKTEGTATLAADIIYNRTLTNGSQWYLISSPVVGETYSAAWASANSIPTSTQDTGNLGVSWYDNTSVDTDSDGGSTDDSATGHWRYLESGNSGSFAKGKGYGIIRSGSGNITFSGTGIYTATQTTTITYGAGNPNNYNLIGNPFTAFLNLSDFFTDNNTANLIGGTVWFWNSNTSTYDPKMSNVPLEANFEIAPGQGFFVEAGTGAIATDNISFDINDINHKGTDTFQKNSDSTQQIYLNISDGSNNRYAKIYYIEGTTTGFENGYDGKLFGGVSNPFAIYSHLLSDSKGDNYQIQSLPSSNYENMIVPVGINASADKEITFTAEALNLPKGIKVYLEDRLTNTFTRLDESNSNYTITLTEKATGIGRFYLHTKSSAVLNTETVNLESISIYKSDVSTLTIAGLSKGKANVKIFNILGKQILDTSFTSNGVQEITLPKAATGVYIIQLTTDNGSLNKKITLE